MQFEKEKSGQTPDRSKSVGHARSEKEDPSEGTSKTKYWV